MNPIYMIPTSLDSMGHSHDISRALDLIASFPLHVDWHSRPTAYQQNRYFASSEDITITLTAGESACDGSSIMTTVIVENPEVTAKLLIPTERPIILEQPEPAFLAFRHLYLMAPYQATREMIHSSSIDPCLGYAAYGLSELIAHALSGEKGLSEEIQSHIGSSSFPRINLRLYCDRHAPALNLVGDDGDIPIQTALPESILALPRFGRASIIEDDEQDMIVATMSTRHWINVPSTPDPMRILEAHPALLRIASLFEQ